MYRLFFKCEKFNQPLDSWDVSNVIDIYDINSWDVSNVGDMESLFEYCIKFNQPLDSWDVKCYKYGKFIRRV